VPLDGKLCKGRELMDKMDQKARAAFFNSDEHGSDFLWYLWCHKDSPLFGKDQMTTFERYFIDDKTTHKENSDPYFKCVEDEETAIYVLDEFGLPKEESHIINGHIPVKVKSGASPIKANGRALQIDGGYSRAYQPTTGIAGFTLIYNSYGLTLVSHEPFDSIEKIIAEGVTAHSTNNLVEEVKKRKTVADTDTGREFIKKIKHLEMLVYAYKNGYLKEKV
jgi:fructose-1,6-bisphosphatase-3